jgi:hypothetical protein
MMRDQHKMNWDGRMEEAARELAHQKKYMKKMMNTPYVIMDDKIEETPEETNTDFIDAIGRLQRETSMAQVVDKEETLADIAEDRYRLRFLLRRFVAVYGATYESTPPAERSNLDYVYEDAVAAIRE